MWALGPWHRYSVLCMDTSASSEKKAKKSRWEDGTYMKKQLGRELESGGKQRCEDGLACGAGIFKEASSDMTY